MRQEFRDLEMLDEITKLKAAGELPPYVTGVYRNNLLQTYKKWRKGTADPPDLHPSLRQAYSDQFLHIDVIYDDWMPSTEKPLTNKRKNLENILDSTTSRKKIKIGSAACITPTATSNKIITLYNGPKGLIWDGVNWSCAYDSLFTILISLWQEDNAQWTLLFNNLHPLLGLWANAMAAYIMYPEIPRNQVRSILTLQDPYKFPMGPVGISLDVHVYFKSILICFCYNIL
ncbi:hypothetical protein B0H19DRAFT_926818 [Mycena capillaripes]|nr:hypothetical protein B0H19DRAFT_926818 [Mycena capillaripes]